MIMLSIDVPRYFHFDLVGPGARLTQAEVEYEKRMKDTVIFVSLSQNLGAQKIAQLFNVYGDINVRPSSSLISRNPSLGNEGHGPQLLRGVLLHR